MPEFKNHIKLTGGQITDLSFDNATVNNYRVLQNCIPTAEGIKPLHALCDAIGPTIGGLLGNTIGMPIYIYNNTAYFITVWNANDIALYKIPVDFVSDNHATTSTSLIAHFITLNQLPPAQRLWTQMTNEEQIVAMLKNIIHRYGDYIVYNMSYMSMHQNLITNTPMSNLYYLDIITAGAAAKALDDIDGSVTLAAPKAEFYVVDDEYLLAIGGFDSYSANITSNTVAAVIGDTVITVGSTSLMATTDYIMLQLDDGKWYANTIASFTPTTITLGSGILQPMAIGNTIRYQSNTKGFEYHPERIRWNHPDAIDRWLPSTRIPPSNLAGWKVMTSVSRIVDVFKFNGSVYIVTIDNLYRATKVGGETGYSLTALNINLKLGIGAEYSIVVKSDSVFILTLDGLYAFNGITLTPLSSSTSEGLFNKTWFESNISNTIYQNDPTYPTNAAMQSIQIGIQVAAIDCIFWFVTYGNGVNAKNMILVYNYELGIGSYLLPPANEIWYPVQGEQVGLAVYDKTANTTRCFAIRPKTTSSIPPDAEIIIESGFITDDPKTSQNLMLNRMFFTQASKQSSDIFSGLTVSVNGYNQDNVLHQTKTVGTFSSSYARGFLDTRISGRYVNFQLRGSPNAWTDWAANLNQKDSALRTFSFALTKRGGRS